MWIDIYNLSLRDAKKALYDEEFYRFCFVIILMSSCSEYQKLLKSGDSQAMYKKAVEYYNNGDYTKASNLFDGIRMVFQGTSKAQSVAYYRAFCSYNQKDYEVAAELFKQFDFYLSGKFLRGRMFIHDPGIVISWLLRKRDWIRP